MYIIIKEDKAQELETKLHKMKACLTEIVDCLHEAKRIHHMPEEYRHSGFDTASEHHYGVEDRRRMGHDPYYSPHDDYRRDRDFEDRGRRGRY